MRAVGMHILKQNSFVLVSMILVFKLLASAIHRLSNQIVPAFRGALDRGRLVLRPLAIERSGSNKFDPPPTRKWTHWGLSPGPPAC